MREYRVLVSEGAILDLQNAYNNIIEKYSSPLDADRWLDDVEKAINSLRIFPEGSSKLEIEPWSSLGIRSYHIRHHRILYVVDKSRREIKIVAVKYSRIDLSKLKL